MYVSELTTPHLTELYVFVMSTVIITGSATLRVLDISYNDIGDDWMAVISEAIQHSKSLTILEVAGCRLSAKGTVKCILQKHFESFAKFTQLISVIKNN